MNKTKKNGQSGQVALILLLLMIVAGSVALSVVSRSITDIGITKQEETKIRVFSAAEAGIENLLRTGLSETSGSDNVGTDLSYSYKIDPIGARTSFAVPGTINNGEIIEIKLDGAVNMLSISWKGDASLEVSSYKQDYSVSRVAYNAVSQAGRGNGFTTSIVANAPYANKIENLDTNGVLFVRIKPLYGSTEIKVESSSNLPNQGYSANVTAQESSGNQKAAVKVQQSIGAQAGIFDYVLWSGKDIAK